jgi:hypothetical protein
MEQSPNTRSGPPPRRHRFRIDEYALLTENAPKLRERLEEWYEYYQPTTPGECELIDMAVMASTQWRRVLACKTALVNEGIRTALFAFDCAQEDEVERYRAMLTTQPGRAVLGLKRSALGVRFLIQRWERLAQLLRDEGTWYGNDRNEAIHYQGARATPAESLFDSEGAFLTWIYCLMAQPEAKDQDFIALGNERVMPAALKDRKTEHWLPLRPMCQQLLEDLVARELAFLRPREEQLRRAYEEPARDSAEIRKQVLAGPDGALLLRHERAHEHQYHCAYQAFIKGRQQTARTGLLPGQPQPALHGRATTADTGVDPDPERELDPDSVSVEQARLRRKQHADAVAPGVGNGIGASIVAGDFMREATMATGLTGEEIERRAREEMEQEEQLPKAPPIAAGEPR